MSDDEYVPIGPGIAGFVNIVLLLYLLVLEEYLLAVATGLILALLAVFTAQVVAQSKQQTQIWEEAQP